MLPAAAPASLNEVRLDVGPLQGRLVRLEPLSIGHLEGLVAAAAEDRSSYGLALVPSGRPATQRYVLDLLAAREAGEAVPFAQLSPAHGRVLGATRFLSPRRGRAGDIFAIEIGGTWLAASAQRSGVNTEAKLLLMSHAFDVWGVSRVDIKTDARNSKARHAIAALGATFEGVLRQWQPSQAAGEEDLLRDTAMYSVIRDEWPAARQRMQAYINFH